MTAAAQPVTSALMRQSKSLAVTEWIAGAIEQLVEQRVIRRMPAEQDLRRLTSREVRVWPLGRTGELSTRSSAACEYQIGVAILERSPESDSADIAGDELLSLAEWIVDRLLGSRVGPADCSVEIRSYDHQPLYDADMLATHRLFACGISLTAVRNEPMTCR